jgi:hypothetical protein
MTFLKRFLAKFLTFDIARSTSKFPSPFIPPPFKKDPSMEFWRRIVAFPGYSVSSDGRVRNDETDVMMTRMVNPHGIVHVGLTRDRVQHKRSVAVLVVEAFLPKSSNPVHNTPICLDGDKHNLCASNLALRPLWFARKYHQQFNEPFRGFSTPIEELNTGERFDSSWHAVIKYGLLDQEIVISVLRRTYVYPTFQMFKLL